MGNLLHNALLLLLGNSSNSTGQSGGTYRERTYAPECPHTHTHTRQYKRAKGTETHAVRGGQGWGGGALRGQVDEGPPDPHL